MTAGVKRRLQDMVLERKGLQRGKWGKLEEKSVTIIKDSRKSFGMRLMEQNLGRPLEEVLAEGSLDELAKRLGVHKATVSKWQLRLGLRGRRDSQKINTAGHMTARIEV